MQLLIIPAVLAIGGYLFNYSTSRNERNAADRHNQAEREERLQRITNVKRHYRITLTKCPSYYSKRVYVNQTQTPRYGKTLW
jgi:hypothetical protein